MQYAKLGSIGLTVSRLCLGTMTFGLQTEEVPVKFYKDREGRMSHHRRMGWLSPWIAGWLNLKVMLVYTPDSFLLKPGFALFGFGFLLAIALAAGPLMLFGAANRCNGSARATTRTLSCRRSLTKLPRRDCQSSIRRL